MQTTEAFPASTTMPSVLRGLVNAGLLGLWLWLYRPIFGYLGIIFSREDFRTNQLLLLGAVVLIALQVRDGHLRPRPAAAPQLHWPALALALGGSALFLIIERTLDVNTLSASLFGLASYGLLGLWMEPRAWRQGMPAVLLLIGALPFGEHMQTFIGYPARILTAALVRDGLAAAGIGAVGIDTILVFENGVSQVDLPCSGVKSLWTGGLFLIAATWIERRPINGRWFGIALVFAALLFVANLARVGALIVVGQVMGWTLAAQMLHVPLGVLAFAAACAAAAGLLRLQAPMAREAASPRSALSQPAALSIALAVAFITMSLLYVQRPHKTVMEQSPAWALPHGLTTTPIPLKPIEVEWLTRDGAESAQRLRFEWRDVTGSMMLVTSRSWRAHHRPERCFEVFGLKVDDSHTYLARAGFPLRVVAVSDDAGKNAHSAVHWFQSASRTTDDYATRIWADVTPAPERWVLVSILFDEVVEPDDPAVQSLTLALHDTMSRRFAEGALP